MLLYCLKCKKKKNSKNPNGGKTNNVKLMILSKCAVRNTKKMRFIKNQEGSGSLSGFGLKNVLSKIPLLGGILFYAEVKWMK